VDDLCLFLCHRKTSWKMSPLGVTVTSVNTDTQPRRSCNVWPRPAIKCSRLLLVAVCACTCACACESRPRRSWNSWQRPTASRRCLCLCLCLCMCVTAKESKGLRSSAHDCFSSLSVPVPVPVCVCVTTKFAKTRFSSLSVPVPVHVCHGQGEQKPAIKCSCSSSLSAVSTEPRQ